MEKNKERKGKGKKRKEKKRKEKEEEAGVCPPNVVVVVEAIGVMASIC
jgi:hypothetical protein